MEEIRVRFAPSPTGHLHIGGARTALYNWLFAKQKKGKFILRIEDTDMERSTEESINAILDSMRWFGLDWDEGPEKKGDYGPYFQSKRAEIYNKNIDQLIVKKKAYRCFCSAEELSKKKEKTKEKKEQYKYDRTCINLSQDQIDKNLQEKKPYVIRLKKDFEGNIIFNDLIKGEIKIHSDTIDDFIIRRSDGSPVYNFAVVCDDALMNINHVIRGDDHISNTPKQILIYKALEYTIPVFAHLPMILGEDKARLSKRHGATAIQQFRDEGFLPEAMRNYMARLGWGYDDSQEIFPTEELIEKFSIEKVSKNPAIFSYKKLIWLNGIYINKLDLDSKIEAVIPFLKKDGLIDDNYIKNNHVFLKNIVEIIQDRLKTLKDITIYSEYFFIDEHKFDENVIEKLFKKTSLQETYEKLIEILDNNKKWDKENILKDLEEISNNISIKRKDYFQAIRAGLTGKLISPDLMDIIILMGKDKIIKKLQYTLKEYKKY